jgi:hypothetical protein
MPRSNKTVTIKTVTIVLILLGCLSLAGAATSAKDLATPAERIKFKKGQHAVLVTGSVADGEVKRYLVGAAADQKIELHLSSANDGARFVLSEFDATPEGARELARGTDWVGTIPELADYAITVSSESKGTTYTLRVTLTQ